MPWRGNLLVGYAEIHRAAGEDVTVRMNKNVLSWFGQVERMSDEKMAKKTYDNGKVSGKKRKRKPQLTSNSYKPQIE